MTSASPYEQLKDDLGYLGLDAAAGCFATLAEEAMTADWPPVVYLERVVAEQARATRNRRLSARLRFAHFPGRKTIEEFDFSFQPSVDRKLVMDLATLRFVTEGRPILFLGQPGCGKSHLATALAILAVEAGYRRLFHLRGRHGAQLGPRSYRGNLQPEAQELRRPLGPRHRRRRAHPDGKGPGDGVLPGREPPL